MIKCVLPFGIKDLRKKDIGNGMLRASLFLAKADTPSAKALKESGAEIVVKEVLETDASIAVYENGYVLYQEGTKATVFPLHKCSGYEYENADGTRKRVKREFFDNENWYVLPLLVASDRMITNQIKIGDYHGIISYSVVVEDRKYLIDPRRNYLDDMIEKEVDQRTVANINRKTKRDYLPVFLGADESDGYCEKSWNQSADSSRNYKTID